MQLNAPQKCKILKIEELTDNNYMKIDIPVAWLESVLISTIDLPLELVAPIVSETLGEKLGDLCNAKLGIHCIIANLMKTYSGKLTEDIIGLIIDDITSVSKEWLSIPFKSYKNINTFYVVK